MIFGLAKLMQTTQQTIKKRIRKTLGVNFLESINAKINSGNTKARHVASASLHAARHVDNVGQECTGHVAMLCNFAVENASKQTQI